MRRTLLMSMAAVSRIARSAARAIINGRVARRLWIDAVADAVVAFVG